MQARNNNRNHNLLQNDQMHQYNNTATSFHTINNNKQSLSNNPNGANFIWGKDPPK